MEYGEVKDDEKTGQNFPEDEGGKEAPGSGISI